MKVNVSLTTSSNCFITLPFKIAQSFHDQPKRFPIPLPLKLRWIDNNTGKSSICYVGWGGEASNNNQTLEIGNNFAKAIGLAKSSEKDKLFPILCADSVEIIACTSNKAETVKVEPISEDDWEIMELNANYLEEQIRNQISIIYANECFPLFIRHNTILNLRIVSIQPSGNECWKLTQDSEFIVTPKPRKKVYENTSNEDFIKQNPIRSCLLKIQSKRLSLEKPSSNIVYLNPKTIKQLRWKVGNIVNIIALQKPFSFSFFDRKYRKLSDDRKQESFKSNKEKPRTILCQIEESNLVELWHIIVPLEIRLYCLLEERTRILVRIHSSGIKNKKLFTPTKIEIHEIHWINSDISEFSRIGIKITPPSKIRNSLLEYLTDKEVYKKEQVIILPISDDSSNNGIRLCSCILKFEQPKDEIFFLNIERIKKKLDIISISSRISLPFPKYCNISDEINGKILSKSTNISLGGFNKEVNQLKDFLYPIFCEKKYKKQLFPYGIPLMSIIGGKHGSGKSYLIEYILKQFTIAPYYIYYHTIYFESLLHRDIHTVQQYITETIQVAKLNQPSIVILENIDAIITTDQQGGYTLLAEQLGEFLFDIITDIAKDKHKIAFIMTVNTIDLLYKTLRSSQLVNLQIELQAPTLQQRIEILESLTKNKTLTIHIDILRQVAKRSEGYLPADLAQLMDRAIHQCSFRSFSTPINSLDDNSNITNSEIIMNDFDKAQESYTPASLKDIKFVKSDKSWKDVGAMENVKYILKETFEWPSKYSTLFSKIPLKLRRGLLLYGPPGCGKTLIASVVAQEFGLNFISVKGPELLNKYIGASEQAVRNLFEQAEAAKPCILFFDEFDSIAPRRGHDNTGVTDRVVNQLLTQLDGVESISSVYVLAATSRPDLIDPALLRPGRLDKSIYCGMPDKEDRYKILCSVSNNLQLDPSVCLEDIAVKTEGYTGADLHALLHNARLEVVHQLIDKEKEILEKDKSNSTSFNIMQNANIIEFGKNRLNKQELLQLTRKMNQISEIDNNTITKKNNEKPLMLITQNHILSALKELRPSISSNEKIRYESIYEDFLSSRGVGAKPSTGKQKATQA